MTGAHAGAHEVGHPAAQPDPLLAFAELALGDLSIGIDTRFVVRAQARPSRLARLPRSHGAIDGVFSDGGRAVPVVDLRAWMGLEVAAAPAQVLVLGVGGRRIALAVDAVRGLVRARASQVERIHQQDEEDGFFHSVVAAGPDRLLSLLDPARLTERVQAWAGAAADGDAGARGEAESVAGRAAAGVSHALVRIGADVLAVPALLVAQVLAHPPVQGLFAGAGGLRGLIQWRGHHLPLLDPAAAFGVAQVPLAAPLAMVLAQGEAMAALPVDEVVAVRTLSPACVTDARAAGIDKPLIEGVALLDDGARVLVVDGAALLAAHAAPGLGRRSPDALAAASGASGAARAASAHIVVDTGRRWAIPMSVLEEIMPLPAHLQPLAARGAGQPAATCAWRRQTLPVLDLREPGTQSSTRTDAGAAPGRLLVVRHNGRHAGLWVDDVVEMLPARAGESTRFRAGGSERCMLTVGQGAARTSYPVLDLDALPFLAHGAI